jgi:hypothetical protein
MEASINIERAYRDEKSNQTERYIKQVRNKYIHEKLILLLSSLDKQQSAIIEQKRTIDGPTIRGINLDLLQAQEVLQGLLRFLEAHTSAAAQLGNTSAAINSFIEA